MKEIQVTIQDVAFGGSGVGRLPDGRIVFVPYTLTGEEVRIRLTKIHKDFAWGELLEILIPSPHRIFPPCEYFGICGGCTYQHASYKEQLRIKEKQLRDTLSRIGGLSHLPPIHIQAAAHPYGYRNKIVVHRSPSGQIGFYATDQHSIVDIEVCLIANEAVNIRLSLLRQAGRKARHIEIADPEEREKTPAGSFHQVNTAMAHTLLSWIRTQILGIQPEPHASGGRSALLDLYCGAGFFSLGLADYFAAVYGVDRDRRAIRLAKERSHRLGISHAQFWAADVASSIDRILETFPSDRNTLLVDPPREGLPKQVTERLARTLHFSQILYVSCNPATLARDLKQFLDNTSSSSSPWRYRLCALGLFDMFPQTAHIEAVAMLQRENRE